MLEVDIEVDRRDFPVAVAFSVGDGERLALFGPSGSGKTTILETIAGFGTLRRGHVVLAGRQLASADRRGDPGRVVARAVPPWQRRIALLRQESALFPHLDVRANLTYAYPGTDRSDLDRLVSRLELEGLLDTWPDGLSGGQRQRVALGRALLSEFNALLLDEPYGGLDARLRADLTGLVRAETAGRQVPAILVAHELVEAQAFADRLGVLDRGRLLQLDTPHEVVRHPLSRRVAELVGYASFLPVEGRASCGLPSGAVIAVHPERVLPGAHRGLGIALTGVPVALRPAGTGFDVELDVGGTRVLCRLPEPPAETPEETPGALTVTVVDPPTFGPDGRRCRRQDSFR